MCESTFVDPSLCYTFLAFSFVFTAFPTLSRHYSQTVLDQECSQYGARLAHIDGNEAVLQTITDYYPDWIKQLGRDQVGTTQREDI